MSDPMKIILNEKGNCTKLLTSDGFSTVLNFFYEENRKGPLTNGGNMSLTNFISALPMFTSAQIFGNFLPFPLEEYIGGYKNQYVSSSYENEYDSENFLVKSTITTTYNGDEGTQTSVKTYTYHYTEL